MKMMNRVFFIIILSIVFLFNSCNRKEDYMYKPILNSKKIHIGDSIFINDVLKKVIFTDSSYVIDSIVYERYDNNSLKAKNAYKNGKQVFENVEYYTNGKIRKYSFIDDDNDNYFYERSYDSSGNLLNKRGELFFQGYLTGINTETLVAKKGTTIKLQIFFPNLPDCSVKLYVKDSDGGAHDVFHKSNYVDFLQTTSWDNDKIGNYELNVWMDVNDKHSDSTVHYNRPLFYKVSASSNSSHSG